MDMTAHLSVDMTAHLSGGYDCTLAVGDRGVCGGYDWTLVVGDRCLRWIRLDTCRR